MIRFRSCVSIALAFTIPVLDGCASFSGAQRAVTGFRTPTPLTKDMQDAILAVAAAPDKKAARNSEIALYLLAADAQYAHFVSNLSSEMHGANVALDVASGAASAVGSVVANAAPELAAGAGFLSGARTSFDKEVYMERTLPAILTSMQTNRTRMLTVIQEHMKLPETEYSMAAAFSELRAYEMTGNINSAINELNVAAAKGLAEANADYSNAIKSCDLPDDLLPKVSAVRVALRDTSKDAAAQPPSATSAASTVRLGKAMRGLGLEPSADATTPDGVQQQRAKLQDYLNRACTAEAVQKIGDVITGSGS